MRRFLFVMYYPERLGGAERFLWDVLRNLDRTRIDPSVVFLRPGPFVDEVRGLGIPATVVPLGRYRHVHRNLAAVGRLARILRREQPDLVVNWTVEGQLFAGAAATLVGLRKHVVWWDHGDHWLNPIVGFIPAVGVGASSQAAAKRGRLRPANGRRFAVSPGVDEPPPSDPVTVASLRASLGIPDDRVVLGVVGRLHPTKDQDRFVEALAILRERGHPVHGLLVGGTSHGLAPEYAQGIERRVTELGLGDAFSFAGQVPDAGPYIELMDVLVNPCAIESFGIAIVEAMARGVPVVAVGAAGPREIIGAGGAGVLVDTNDPVELADGIEGLMGSADVRRALGEAGRDRFRSQFTTERMIRDLELRLLGFARNGTGRSR